MSLLRLCLIDDDPTSLFLVERLLKLRFPALSCFECPLKAFEWMHRTPTDALITDHGLEPMTGTELIQQLRAETVRIPMVTISNNPDAAGEAIVAGADDFIDKKDIERLPQVLSKMLAVSNW
ncbi:MAG TPA: response regulator [Verrucomicrobiae bacterium]|nr:response regulator [Verrucomicrobiae bacterium]